jgi:ABC-type proline/glycine betaine transport system permease subunit
MSERHFMFMVIGLLIGYSISAPLGMWLASKYPLNDVLLKIKEWRIRWASRKNQK